jgi:hypothetical protein
MNAVSHNLVIIVLILLLILTVLGVKIIGTGEFLMDSGVHLLGDLAFNISSNTGKIINASSDTAAVVTKTGIDITNGAVNDAGYLMQGKSLDMAIHQTSFPVSDPQPSTPSPNSLTWCLVDRKGPGHNTCAKIGEGDHCNSGQVYTSESKCVQAGA